MHGWLPISLPATVVVLAQGTEHELPLSRMYDVLTVVYRLNAMANHGYLPRSGVATPLEFDHAITTMPRVGVIFAQILSFYVRLIRYNLFIYCVLIRPGFGNRWRWY